MADSLNAEASCFWEGQIRVVVQDVPLCFLFENKGSMYDGKGFEMLASIAINSVANAFTKKMVAPVFSFLPEPV